MNFTDYMIPTRDVNLLALTATTEGASNCDCLRDVSSADTVEVLPSPNPRETWLRIPGAIMRVHHETGRVTFTGTPMVDSVRVSFERIDTNRH